MLRTEAIADDAEAGDTTEAISANLRAENSEAPVAREKRARKKDRRDVRSLLKISRARTRNRRYEGGEPDSVKMGISALRRAGWGIKLL